MVSEPSCWKLTSPAASWAPVKLVAAAPLTSSVPAIRIGDREGDVGRAVVGIAEAEVGGGQHIAGAFGERGA